MSSSPPEVASIVANLDIENTLAAFARNQKPAKISGVAQAAASVAGSLLSIYGTDSNCLLGLPQPAAVNLQIYDEVPSSSLVSLEKAQKIDGPQLWWCPFAKGSDDLNSQHPVCLTQKPDEHYPQISNSIGILLKVGNRQFAAQHCPPDLHPALAGRLIQKASELGAALERFPQSLQPHPQWVLKSCYSAAGRDRLLSTGLDYPEVKIKNFLDRHGPSILQPWLTRSDDFGLCAWVGEEETTVISRHRLIVNSHGGFRGIELHLTDKHIPRIDPQTETLLDRQLHHTAADLRAAGYRGPFSIDAIRYQIGEEKYVHPLLEINPRLSFGAVARAWVDRLGARFDPAATVSLHFSSHPPQEQKSGSQRHLLLASGQQGRGPFAYLLQR